LPSDHFPTSLLTCYENFNWIPLAISEMLLISQAFLTTSMNTIRFDFVQYPPQHLLKGVTSRSSCSQSQTYYSISLCMLFPNILGLIISWLILNVWFTTSRKSKNFLLKKTAESCGFWGRGYRKVGWGEVGRLDKEKNSNHFFLKINYFFFFLK
jgi:hypothetical protein